MNRIRNNTRLMETSVGWTQETVLDQGTLRVGAARDDDRGHCGAKTTGRLCHLLTDAADWHQG